MSVQYLEKYSDGRRLFISRRTINSKRWVLNHYINNMTCIMRLRNRKKEFYACHQTAEEKGILETRFIDCYIGSGVFALDDIQKGQLVCYYHGELISGKDGMLRLCSKHNEGSFLFFFNDAGKQLCIDATHSTGLGRLINDNHLNPNCNVKLEEGPKLAIYTIKDVSKGEEIRYDYKDNTAFWRRRNAPRKPIYSCPVKEPIPPVNIAQPPVEVEQLPADVGQHQVDVGQSPIELRRPLVDVGQPAADSVKEQVKEPLPPVNIAQPPVDIEQLPADVRQQQVDVGQSPMEIEQPLVDVGQPAADSVKKQVKEPLPPVNIAQPPVDIEQLPADVGQQRVDVGQSPMELRQSSVDVGQPAADSTKEQVKESLPPVNIAQPPVDIEQLPADVRQQQVDVGQSPMEIEQSSVDVGQPAADSMIEQVKEPLPPVNIAQPPVDIEQLPADVRQQQVDVGQSPMEIEQPLVDVGQPAADSVKEQDLKKYYMTSGSRYCDAQSIVIVFHKKAAYKYTLQTYPDLEYEDFVAEDYGWKVDTVKEPLPPVNIAQPPVDIEQLPADVGQQQVDVGQSPMELRQSSVDVGQPAADSMKEQVKESLPPVNIAQPPLDIEQLPADVRQQQVDVGQSPMEIEQPLVDVGQPAADCMKEQVKESLPPVDIEQPPIEVEQLPAGVRQSPIELRQAFLDVGQPVADSMKEQGIQREHYSIIVQDSGSSTFSKEGAYTLNIKRKSGALILEEYVSDSDCSDIVPVQNPVPLHGVIKASADSTCVKRETNSGSEASEVMRIQEVGYSEKRTYDKKQSCYFCEKDVIKIARHLEQCHANVPEIGSLPKAKKHDEETKAVRAAVFAKYRNLGNFNNNIQVLHDKKGTFIVGRRPHTGHNYSPKDFLPCQYCLTFFIRHELWRHAKKCQFRHGKIEYEKADQEKREMAENIKAGESLLQGALGASAFSSPDENQHFKELVLDSLRNDDVSRCIKSDNLLILFGRAQFRKLGSGRAGQVREKLRILGRLKLKLRDLTKKESASIDEFITVEMFDTCMEAVKCIGVISDEPSLTGTKTYSKPSTSLKAGQFLKKLAGMKRGQAARKRDSVSRDDAAEFIELYKEEFKDEVSSVARQTLNEKKFNKKNVLPVTDDLLKYVDYLERRMRELTCSICDSNWHDLAKVTLARVLCFNKRRASEAARILIDQYQSRPGWIDENSELTQSLQLMEKKMLKRMDLVEVLGKNGKRVPVLLTKTMVSAIDVLIMWREKAGVDRCNPYVFAQGCFNHMKGSDSIRRTTKEVQLQHPERITTTKLRKYLATISQLFNLSSTELEELARHMGHELTVHRHYYRLQDDVIELAKVSRLLLAVEEGKAHAFQGCSLDDINVTDIKLEEDERMDDSSVDTVQEIDGDSESDLIEDFDVEDVNANSIDDSLEKEHEEIQDNEYQCAGKQKKDKPSASAKKLLLKDEDSEPKQTKCPKKRWTKEERDILEDLATKSASEKKPPRKAEILKLQAQQPVLKSLKWLSIKYQVWAMAQQKMSGKKKILENWGI